MGPETGCRTFDKLDFILFPLVLLLRVSLRFSALLKNLSWLLCCFYDYFFNQASPCGVHHEVLPTIFFLSYLGIRFALLLLYWTHSLTVLLLSFSFELWQGLSFWPRLFYRLFNPNASGRSVLQILTDPEDLTSSRTKMKNLPSAGHGIMANTHATLLTGILPSRKSRSIRVTGTLMLSAHGFGASITMVLSLLSLLLF